MTATAGMTTGTKAVTETVKGDPRQESQEGTLANLANLTNLTNLANLANLLQKDLNFSLNLPIAVKRHKLPGNLIGLLDLAKLPV